MGKHGPCYHCGTTSTPLWRNGPPEKPILCNACGSRWRTKGSLVNYTPLHARAEPEECEDYRIPRPKSISIKIKEPKVLKRKLDHEYTIVKKKSPDYYYTPLKTVDEDTSNRSSSGSAISNSESCVQLGSVEASDLTGPAQSVVWEKMVPSRKRTCVGRPKQSRVEKLTKDLYTIMHEQSSHFSGSSEEDLLFESDQPMVSVEIGHGSVLIRHPSSIAQEEESEASSLSFENKVHLANEAYSHSMISPLYTSKVVIEDKKWPGGQGMHQEELSGDKDEHEKLLILGNHSSPLCSVDLKEIINYQVFASHLTNDEQQQLLQFLPDLDTDILPHSLQSMFASPEFEENFNSFQKLLSEGFLDLGAKAEDCGTLKKLALCDSKQSSWVEQYTSLKDMEGKSCKRGADILTHGSSTNGKTLREGLFRSGTGTKMKMKSPGYKDFIGDTGSYFSPRSLYPLPSISLMVNPFQYMDENSDQDLLLDVPSNNYFPEAELLNKTSASTSSSLVYPQLTRA